jgi:MinD-like ATPase involved in chromosome partitioning or flagellar assembly
MIISFISVKGGVGKTTLALETASSLANDFKKKVLVIDANFSAPNLALHLGIKPNKSLHDVLAGKLNANNAIQEIHGFDFIPASLNYTNEIEIMNLKRAISQVSHKYDFVILDSSPNYKELIPVVASSDKLFIVTTPDHVTLITSLKAANLAKARRTHVEGIIINKIRSPEYEMTLNNIQDFFSVPVVARIEDDKGLIEAMFFRKPITVHNKNNKVSKEIKRFASALCGVPEKRFFDFFTNLIKKEKVNREIMRQNFYEEQIN